MGELRVGNSRAIMAGALALGALCLLGAALFEPLRGTFKLLLFGVLFLVGLVGCLDRRIKLEITGAGVRYAGFGPAVLPWHEFSGFRWKTWRGSPYLQLTPRRPTEVLHQFSALGKLNHYAARLVGTPVFAIRVAPLAVPPDEVAAHLGAHLPELPREA